MTDPINIPILTRWTDCNGDHEMINGYAEITPDLARQIVLATGWFDNSKWPTLADSFRDAAHQSEPEKAQAKPVEAELGFQGDNARAVYLQDHSWRCEKCGSTYTEPNNRPVPAVKICERCDKPVEAAPAVPAADASGDDAAVEAIARVGRIAHYYKATFDEYARAILSAIRAGKVPGVIWSKELVEERDAARAEAERLRRDAVAARAYAVALRDDLAAVKARTVKMPTIGQMMDRLPQETYRRRCVDAIREAGVEVE